MERRVGRSAAWSPQPAALALVGLAAFFTATVRTPVTGMVLATEMTATTVVLPPMLGACAVAMLVAQVLRSQPIYESLTERAVLNARRNLAEQRGSSPAMCRAQRMTVAQKERRRWC